MVKCYGKFNSHIILNSNSVVTRFTTNNPMTDKKKVFKPNNLKHEPC